ncbi:MAG: hypothetical protein GX557_10235, partial [Chloroflexi bacterium]|nr:hypothetical protein [Chloroflexota bacterium]
AAYDTGGWAGVDALYAKPPTSTEQVLHPERYREGDEPQMIAAPPVTTTLGAGWQVLDADALGELGLQLSSAQLAGTALGEAAAEGWGGDAYVVLRNTDTGELALLLTTVWDTPAEASEFFRLYRALMAHRSGYVERVGSLVGELSTREWSNGTQWVRLEQDGSSVTVAIAASAETAALAAGAR